MKSRTTTSVQQKASDYWETSLVRKQRLATPASYGLTLTESSSHCSLLGSLDRERDLIQRFTGNVSKIGRQHRICQIDRRCTMM